MREKSLGKVVERLQPLVKKTKGKGSGRGPGVETVPLRGAPEMQST